MKKALILIKSGPYGESSSAEAFRALIALPSLGIETTAVALDDGVFNLVKAADPTVIGWKGNVASAFAGAAEFDARLLVHRPSLESRSLIESEIIETQGFLDDVELKRLVDQADVLLPF